MEVPVSPLLTWYVVFGASPGTCIFTPGVIWFGFVMLGFALFKSASVTPSRCAMLSKVSPLTTMYVAMLKELIAFGLERDVLEDGKRFVLRFRVGCIGLYG